MKTLTPQTLIRALVATAEKVRTLDYQRKLSSNLDYSLTYAWRAYNDAMAELRALYTALCEKDDTLPRCEDIVMEADTEKVSKPVKIVLRCIVIPRVVPDQVIDHWNEYYPEYTSSIVSIIQDRQGVCTLIYFTKEG